MAASPKNAAPSFSRLENACEGKNVEPHWTPYLPTECRKLTAALGQQQPVASLALERLVPARSGHSNVEELINLTGSTRINRCALG